MRTQVLWTIALIGGWLKSQAGWAQTYEDMVAGLTREQLLQLKQQIQLQEQEWHNAWLAQEDLGREAEEYRKTRRFLQTNLPQPLLYFGGDTALVKVEAVRRADAEVFKVYPDSPRHLHYYEVQARVLKVWLERWRVAWLPQEGVLVNDGMTLSLLWAGIRRNEKFSSDKPLEEPLPNIWEVGQVCLVYILNLVPKTGFREDSLGMSYTVSTDPQDYWWIPFLANNWYPYPIRPAGSSHKNVLKWASRGEPAFAAFQVAGELTSRIESPPKQVLQLLDEEVEFYRLPQRRSVQLAWVRQRVLDKSLPLWKRQRALVYWFLANEREDEKEKPPASSGSPDVHRRIEYLTFLLELSEPLLQAHGLWVMRVMRQGHTFEASPAMCERLLDVLTPFLAADCPVDVRRQASEVLAGFVGSGNLLDYRDWALERAGWLRGLWEQEKDNVVRVWLWQAWTGILRRDLTRQKEAVEKRLKELDGDGK
ncbi:MAG: hypothetical protein KatS3mg019_2358 [Fimbriimonadales bacterium]|nr:MAG: hypothetical protein KatS3mg019_2358 [Fimbriimonadales bacterium]